MKALKYEPHELEKMFLDEGGRLGSHEQNIYWGWYDDLEAFSEATNAVALSKARLHVKRMLESMEVTLSGTVCDMLMESVTDETEYPSDLIGEKDVCYGDWYGERFNGAWEFRHPSGLFITRTNLIDALKAIDSTKRMPA